MWAALSPLAKADPSPLWQAGATVGAALITLTSAVLVAWLALRGTSRNTDAAREAQWDARVDKELDRLRVAAAEAEAHEDNARLALAAAREALADMREAYTRLRLAVRWKGFDPDELVRAHEQGGPGGQP